MTNTLINLIKIPSITSDLTANLAALHWCQNQLTDRGVTSEIISFANRPILVWGTPISKTQILINTHLDVVPGPDAIFLPRKSKGKLFGRGSADSKAFASILLHLPLTPTSQNITFSLSCDEEVGGESTKQFISILPQLKFAIFGEPTNLKIVTQAKGIMQVKITAMGKSSHGSRPWLGTNAIEHLASLVTSFQKVCPTPTANTTNSTFNFSLISGGTAINQVPNRCEVSIDVRVNPDDSSHRILNLLTSHFTGCQIDLIKSESPIKTSSKNIFVRQFADCLQAQGIKPQFTFEHGSSDARHCTALNIPAIVFGPSGANLHQDDEWVSLSSLNKVQKTLEDFIKNVTID